MDYKSFASANRELVQAALKEIDAKRVSRWTDTISVQNSSFIERIKNAMGAMVMGHSVQPTESAFELQEAQSTYNAIFDPENRDIDPKKG